MGTKKEGLEMIKKGKRITGMKSGKPEYGRGLEEIRPLSMKVGFLKRADGSCLLKWGNNKVLAAVYGPREMHPKHAQNPYESVLRYRYNMAPFSVDERIRPGRNRRSTEISKVSREAFESVVLANYFPKTSIDVFVEILQATAGSRVAGITAAAVALANAGIPMKDLLVGCAAGKVEGKIVLDLGKEEDNYGEADLPVVYAPRTGRVSMLQMDGNFTQEEFKKAFKLAIEGCKQISEMQKKALKEGSYNWKDGDTL